MAMIQINNLSFQYADTEENTLENLSLHIKEGDFVLLCGPSGCGKTTLLRLLKKEIAPVGHVTGDILYRGKLLNEWDDRILIEEIGFVFQDPENQIIMDDVMQEIVFNMENLHYSQLEMRKRLAELVHFFGMESLLQTKTSELSGGQKQMLNLLSVLLLKPTLLLLDEPTSQLDPVAAKDFILMLERMNKEMGITIILVEHRLEELFSIADHVVCMEQGNIIYEGTSKDVIYSAFQQQDEVFSSYVPSISQLYMKKERNPKLLEIPLTVKECKAWLRTLPTFTKRHADAKTVTDKRPILELTDIYFQYTKKAPFVLKNLSIQIKKGEFFSIVGGNGSGKSTFLKASIGNIKPQRGKVSFLGKETSKLKGDVLFRSFAYLPQHPQSFFIHDSIEKEMQETVKRHHVSNGSEIITKMLDAFGIQHIRYRHPYDCSGGEMQKAALACMLLGNPEILFIDEPTKGLDPISKENFAEIIQRLHQNGLTIVMVTHDIEFAARYAERCAMMFDGAITTIGTPKELFSGNYFYTTAINRATSNMHIEEMLTLEEAIETWPNHVLI
ncbi:ABC transporter ATP-binding protein [Virgibacillus soli]|uniref:ABC transporter ATP-binding protein n=1 Tax=Paracerasibacillus soli TaxID=480284 RepID=UPI0035E762F1